MTKKILIAVPDLLLAQADVVAGCESRTRSDLVREAIRRYLEEFNRKKAITGTTSADVQLLNRALAHSD